MMGKKVELLLWLIILAFPLRGNAQDIRVKRFEVNYTSLTARMNQMKDNAGEACAVLRCYVKGNDYSIEPNMGIVKREELDGEIRLWVPSGTKRLTIRHKGLKPLIGYQIPLRIESKTDYDVDIENATVDSRHIVFLGAGYNIMSIAGPSLGIGVNVNHHNIELNAVYGLNKTDDLYFFDNAGNVTAGYSYNAVRAQLNYGYEIPVSKFFAITPLFGVVYNAYIGKELANGRNTSYKNANSISASGALRFTISMSNSVKFCVTPEYDEAIYKDKACKLLGTTDNKMKNWHSGINLHVGLMVFF